MVIHHDAPLDIAVGRYRQETSWQNKNVMWSKLVEKISTTTRTAEKYAEYVSAKKDRQAEIKDVGGFVGGYMTRGRRKAGSVQHRQLLTLDLDFADAGFWADFRLQFSCAAAMYTTHAHSPEKPRYRLLIPLNREVFCDEYVAIARRVAGDLDIDRFDDTTYQAERLMYWPSTSADGEFECEVQDGPWLDADKVLAGYRDWRDSSEWPVSSRHRDKLHRAVLKAGDPLGKPGLVGAFCRAYDIETAIDTFLTDEYEACDVEGRYTYKHGSTAGGLVLYEEKFAYSHHGTDPASEQLCNAFDLVRLHKFGLLDEEARAGTPINKMPSYVKMVEFCSNDAAVRKLLVTERLEGAQDAFGGLEVGKNDGPGALQVGAAGIGGPETIDSQEVDEGPADQGDSWKEKLEVDKKSNVQPTIDNIVLILENDPRLKGAFAWDEFESRPVALRRLPWRSVSALGARYLRDTDNGNLAHYLERAYGISNLGKTKLALMVLFERYRLHPVRQYLNGLVWDGVPRVDRLLTTYLGAADRKLFRQFIRKVLAGAVKRVFEPGCKFDYNLVLIGEQGDKKSTFIRKLAGLWFSDSLTTVQGKEAAEQLQGVWLIEVAELAGFRRAEQETIKHFIAKEVDRFRAAYGEYSANYYRQCVFIGTTNKRDFLQDITGNRRYWPVEVDKSLRIADPAEMTPEEVAQIWAEAVQIYRAGEPLYLDDEMEAAAKALQADHMEPEDDRKEAVIAYLETLLPSQWEDMGLMERRAFLAGGTEYAGTRQRTRVTVGEIWTEALGCMVKDMTRYNTKAIHDIMTGMPGWGRYAAKMRGVYGVQRGYVRKDAKLIGFSHVPAK